ncbi:Nicastrin-like protein [Leptotrombidium deliense]|uniref:Nicastrin n=1 Tax=Leptotrombidium deliense TaxID=299467 RepID=A0A443SCM5_9ACAR|nr:Nicastrin-like protein [Leptotrombidium deliense]
MHYQVCTRFALPLKKFTRQSKVTSIVLEDSTQHTKLAAKVYFVFFTTVTNELHCLANADGNVGVLFIVKNDEDYDWVLTKGNTLPFIPALYISQFTTEKLLKLRDSGRVSGAILIHATNESRPTNGFSPDKLCPNENFGVYVNKLNEYSHCSAANSWNLENQATNMMFIDWKMPIYLMRDEHSIQNLTTCFEQFNKPQNGVERSWPLCAVQLTARMHSAGDTPTCMRRNSLPYIPLSYPVQHCDPISSYNIFGSLRSTTKKDSIPNRSITLITTKLDSLSMFLNTARGASVLMTVITLLSVAQTLSKNKQLINTSNETNNVLFAFFDGENWDYIGSSRAAFDLKRSHLKPIKLKSFYEPAKFHLSHISHIIELDQIVFNNDANNVLWIHKDSNVSAAVKQSVERLTKQLEKQSSIVEFKVADEGKGLPPTSLRSFLREDNNIPGIVISSYNNKFVNKYHNGFLDTSDLFDHNSSIRYITNVSTAISKTVAFLLNISDTNIVADEATVKSMYDCFFKDLNCSLFNSLFGRSMNGKPLDLITSVAGYTREHQMYLISSVVEIVYRLLTNFTGKAITGYSKEMCSDLNKSNSSNAYEWIPKYKLSTSNGSCVVSSCFLTEALSPAFIDGESNWNSNEYSTWTESVWRSSGARIFLMPSLWKELFTLITGIVIFTLSFIIVFIFKRCVPQLLEPKSEDVSENNVIFKNHVSGLDAITFSPPNSNRCDVITTQL